MELHHIALRALFAFAFLQLLVRLSGKRTVHEGTAFDFVLALVLGDMVDDLLWAETSAGTFAAAVSALVFTHTALAWVGARHRGFNHLITGRPRILISEGRVQRREMRRAHVSDREIESMLRTQGLPPDAIAEVAVARLEVSGMLSLAPREEARPLTRGDVDRRSRESAARGQ